MYRGRGDCGIKICCLMSHYKVISNTASNFCKTHRYCDKKFQVFTSIKAVDVIKKLCDRNDGGIGSWMHQQLNPIICDPGSLAIQHTKLLLLTHLPLNKMAATLADDNFKFIFLNENDRILIPFSLKFVSRSPIDNTPALVQVMAWCRTDDKPLPAPILTKFTDAKMRH